MLAWKELHGWKLDYLCSLHGSSSNVIFVPWKHSLDIVIWCKEPAKASFLSYTFEKKNLSRAILRIPMDSISKLAAHGGCFLTCKAISRRYKKTWFDDQVTSTSSSCFTWIMCPLFEKFPKIHRKTPAPESLNNVAGLRPDVKHYIFETAPIDPSI